MTTHEPAQRAASGTVAKKLKCTVCNGVGTVNLHGARDSNCPECDGDGWIFEQRQRTDQAFDPREVWSTNS